MLYTVLKTNHANQTVSIVVYDSDGHIHRSADGDGDREDPRRTAWIVYENEFREIASAIDGLSEAEIADAVRKYSAAPCE